MRRGMLAGSLALLACGEDASIADAEVADVCGASGPVQILPLERDEVAGETWPVVRHGDRYLYGIRVFDHPISNVDATRYPPQERGYAELGARVESIDRCGGDRRVIADGVDTVFAPRTESEPWLGLRSETRTLFWIDPEGRFAARELAYTGGYGRHLVTDHVVHVFREAEQDIVRFTLEGEAPVVETVLDRVVDAQTFSIHRDLETPASVYALRDDGELVLVHLPSGRMESIAKGVGGFTTDRDPRFVVWWPGDPRATLPAPVTQAWLVDRGRGRTVALAFDEPGELSFRLAGPVLATWRKGNADEDTDFTGIAQTRLTFLADLRAILLDDQWDSIGSAAAGNRFTARPPPGKGGTYLFESSAEGVRIVGGPLSHGYQGAFWTEDCERDDATELATPCDLLRTPFDTMQPELYQPRAWSYFALPGDRWLVFAGRTPDPHAWRPDPRGTLWVVEGETGAAARLDRDVSGGFPLLHDYGERTTPLWASDEVVYQVRALSGDRTGLWRARFE